MQFMLCNIKVLQSLKGEFYDTVMPLEDLCMSLCKNSYCIGHKIKNNYTMFHVSHVLFYANDFAKLVSEITDFFGGYLFDEGNFVW